MHQVFYLFLPAVFLSLITVTVYLLIAFFVPAIFFIFKNFRNIIKNSEFIVHMFIIRMFEKYRSPAVYSLDSKD